MNDVRLLFGITPEDWANTPETVQLAYGTLLDLVTNLESRVRALEAQLNQTSRNSSKPPSSDPPNTPPPAPRTARGRKKGAQVGHSDQQRPELPPEQVDTIISLRPEHCPSCHNALGAELPLAGPIYATQIWELPPFRALVTEYQQHSLCCPTCQQTVTAELPNDIAPGAFGARATALVGLLHGRYRLSIRETATFLNEVCQLPLSLGSVVSCCQRLSDALAPVDAAIQSVVQSAPVVWVDETSWNEQQQRCWLWVACTPVATCFRIEYSRSQAARRRLLGEAYGGIVHSDRACAYGDLPVRQRQLCWAHLKRNFLGLLEQKHQQSHTVARLLSLTQQVFAVWSHYRSGWFDQVALQQALMVVRLQMREALERGSASQWRGLRDMSRQLLKYWDGLWSFSQVEGVEPTNNTAERAIRFAVVWRKSCYGTQSASGSRFVERMLSVSATCRQQARPLMAFLVDALQAAWSSQPAPILVSPP